MRNVADLHIHTIASDGLHKPEEIVARASAMGLMALSITDHDTVDGLEIAMQESRNLNLEFIPGIELSTEYLNREIHILGYYIDYKDNALCSLLKTLQGSRYNRAEKMVHKLSSMGFCIDMPSVLRLSGEAAPGRPHIARALVEKGSMHSVKQVFDKLIGYQCPAYVERFKLTPQEAFQVITNSGGIAVWAHPGLKNTEKLLELFLLSGLSGLEVYHPEHSWKEVRYLLSLAKEYNLCITGGSDYHGDGLGREIKMAACGISKNDLAAFKKYYYEKAGSSYSY